MKHMKQLLEGCENALVAIAGILMLTMMVLTAVDVLMRYAFNAPMNWVFDLVTHNMLVAAFFFSFSIALRTGEHVAVDYFVRKFNPGLRRVVMSLAWLLCALLVGVVAVVGAHEAYVAWSQAEVIAGVIPWPVWIQKIIIPLGMLPLTIRLLLLGLGGLQPAETIHQGAEHPLAENG